MAANWLLQKLPSSRPTRARSLPRRSASCLPKPSYRTCEAGAACQACLRAGLALIRSRRAAFAFPDRTARVPIAGSRHRAPWPICRTPCFGKSLQPRRVHPLTHYAQGVHRRSSRGVHVSPRVQRRTCAVTTSSSLLHKKRSCKARGATLRLRALSAPRSIHSTPATD